MLENLTYIAKVIRTKFISDQSYLTKRFIKKLGYKPNFNQPLTFNEKVTARMIYQRNTLHTLLADKLAVRNVISKNIHTKYLVPLIGSFKSFDEIDFNQLPNQFVLKCNHDSGSAIVCNNKNTFDIDHARTKLNKHLKQNMYFNKREWHYKNIKPVILIEQYINLYQDPITKLMITTCRIHCFENKAIFFEVDVLDTQNNEFSNIYDENWVLQPFTVDLKQNSPEALDKPNQLKELIKLAEDLCFVSGYSRIDFLIAQDQIYFSEITLTPNAGRMIISPPEWDIKLGTYWISHLQHSSENKTRIDHLHSI